MAAIKASAGTDWPQVKTASEKFLGRGKKRMALLASLRVSGELSQEDFESRLEDQKMIVEAELNALEVIGKAMAQNVANAAIEVLEKAVAAAIKVA